MKYRQVGRSGLTVSVVGLGCNNFGGERTSTKVAAYGSLDFEATEAVVHAGLDAGVTFFDTASRYANGGSERFLGRILHNHRDEVVIGTKWGSGEAPNVAWGSRRFIRKAVEESLVRLQTDFIDLYQLHWPDPRTPIEETLSALNDLVVEGKVRYVGSSHFDGWEIANADWIAKTNGYERMISAQNHYSLLQRVAERELIPACEHFGVGLFPYFPLENGLLTGKYKRGVTNHEGDRLEGKEIPDSTFDVLEKLEVFAQARSQSLLVLAISALAAQPAVASVITGATKPSQIVANAAAADFELPSDDLAELRDLLARFPSTARS